MAETFPAVDILRSASKDVSFREQRIEMGDRFVHLTRFTLHPYNETWRIPMRDISPDDRQRVVVFLLARADDGEHFLWTPPDGVEEKQFRVDNWEAIQSRGWNFDIDLVFRRVWEPATPQLSPTANSCDTGPDFWVARLTDPAVDSNYNNSYRSRTFVTVGGVSYHVFPHAPTGTSSGTFMAATRRARNGSAAWNVITDTTLATTAGGGFAALGDTALCIYQYQASGSGALWGLDIANGAELWGKRIGQNPDGTVPFVRTMRYLESSREFLLCCTVTNDSYFLIADQANGDFRGFGTGTVQRYANCRVDCAIELQNGNLLFSGRTSAGAGLLIEANASTLAVVSSYQFSTITDIHAVTQSAGGKVFAAAISATQSGIVLELDSALNLSAVYVPTDSGDQFKIEHDIRATSETEVVVAVNNDEMAVLRYDLSAMEITRTADVVIKVGAGTTPVQLQSSSYQKAANSLALSEDGNYVVTWAHNDALAAPDADTDRVFALGINLAADAGSTKLAIHDGYPDTQRFATFTVTADVGTLSSVTPYTRSAYAITENTENLSAPIGSSIGWSSASNVAWEVNTSDG